MESSLLRVCEDFPIQGYEDWSFRIWMCLQAHHVLMCDVIENDTTPIYADAPDIEGTDPGKATYVKSLKIPKIILRRKEKMQVLMVMPHASFLVLLRASTLQRSGTLTLLRKCGIPKRALVKVSKKLMRTSSLLYATCLIILNAAWKTIEMIKNHFTRILLEIDANKHFKYS